MRKATLALALVATTALLFAPGAGAGPIVTLDFTPPDGDLVLAAGQSGTIHSASFTDAGSGLNVTVYAFYQAMPYDTTFLQTAYLTQSGGGIGVRNAAGEPAPGDSDGVDDFNNRDFLVFEFDPLANFSTIEILTAGADVDIRVWNGTPTAGPITFTSVSPSNLGSIPGMNGPITPPVNFGVGDVQAIYSLLGLSHSNQYLIVTPLAPDGNFDGFWVRGMNLGIVPVPPAAALGLVGMGVLPLIRRRKAQK